MFFILMHRKKATPKQDCLSLKSKSNGLSTIRATSYTQSVLVHQQGQSADSLEVIVG